MQVAVDSMHLLLNSYRQTALLSRKDRVQQLCFELHQRQMSAQHLPLMPLTDVSPARCRRRAMRPT